MKKDLQRVQQEKRELEERISKIDSEKRKSEIVKKYVMDGVDEEVAEKYAAQEIRNDMIEEKLEIIDFRESNYDLLQKYPQARQDVKTIIKNAKLTGMTAEQICKGMYADAETPSYQQRIRQQMTDKTSDSTNQTSTEAAARASIPKQSGVTSASDRQMKARIERMFNGGKPLTEDEMKIIMKHF
jgi:sulfur relay (sulfurtransferase) DsrC/TusE family protein